VIGEGSITWVVRQLPGSIHRWVYADWTWLAGLPRWNGHAPGLMHAASAWVQELLVRGLGFVMACALITLAVGSFYAVFIFRRDPDDNRNETAPQPAPKSAFVPETNEFGLVTEPVPPMPSLRASADALVGRLQGRISRN
jgi:hypothetical protein